MNETKPKNGAAEPLLLTKRAMLLDFLRGCKRYFVAGALGAVLSTLADMLMPRIIEFTVDSVLDGQAATLPPLLGAWLAARGGVTWLRANLWVPALAVLGCSLAAVLLKYFYQTTVTKGGEKLVQTMRDRLFGHIEHLSMAWHAEHQTGDIIQRCTSDVDMVKQFLSGHLITLFGNVVTISMAVAFLFEVNVRLALVALAGIPAITGFSYWFHRRIRAAFRVCDENEGALSAIAQENLTGVRVVRAFGQEKREQTRFAAQNEVVTDEWVKLGRYMSLYWSANNLLTATITLIVLCWGCVLCVNGEFTLGGLLAAILYLGMMIGPMRMLGRVLSEMSKTGVSIDRLCEIMAEPVEADAPHATTPPMDRDVAFEHVSYGYAGGQELLHDVSFTIPAGTTLGILGGTGSGKTTLMNLLTRLYPLPADGGRITIGGEDLQTMRAEWVRRNIGYVMQEPFLFSRSIADNIAITQPQPETAAVRTAARAACLEAVVDEFPDGFDTYVGERGVTLSGGQKQRTAIARALIGSTPILIFDDSLSAVDTETDAEIRENLKKYMGKATVILISHRVTTLMAADQILVLEDGRVTAQGTHEQLAAQPGLYRTICEIQQGKSNSEEAQNAD
jgi:ATP-binding cassette subfamily B protein